MPRQKSTGSTVKIPKELKAMGATGAKMNGNKIELTFNGSKMPSGARRAIAAGMGKTNSAQAALYNDPWAAPYFEGPTSTTHVLSAHSKMKQARNFFNSDPLVGKIIEFMKVFSNDGFKLEHPDPKIKKFYDDWATAVDLDLVLSWIFLEYYRSGNVITYREMVNFDKGFKFMSQEYSVDGNLIKGNANLKASAAKRRVQIPGAYTILDPVTVTAHGNNAFDDRLSVNLSDMKAERRESGDPTDLSTLYLKQLPKSITIKHQGSEGIPLSKKNVKRILRMRQPYESYGSVLMERAFAAIHEKNKLRQMDLTMVNSVINQIVKVTIGNDEYPATPRQLNKLALSFQNIGKSQVIFWNHTLNIEVIRPDTKVLNHDKYERVNEDIRNAFGISEVLTGGGSAKTNFATAFLSLKSFLTNLQEGRKDVLRWVRSEMQDIAEVMGFDSIPEPSFNPLSLTDEIAEKQIIIQLIDRGVISYQTAQSRLGYDPEIEKQRREEELPLMREGVLGLSGSPFMQQIDEEITDTPEEVSKQIEIDKKKEPVTKDQEAVKKNDNPSKTKNPNEKIADKKVPKKKMEKVKNKIKGGEGRPKTENGKKFSGRRKATKIKGQASELLEKLRESGYSDDDIIAITQAAKDLTGK